MLTVASWALLAAPAQAAGPATSLVLQLSPNLIAADGSSTTVATATVTDAGGNPVAGDSVSFSSSDSNAIGAVADNGNGTYTATITSTTTPGSVTITATDNSVTNVGGQATLIQTGPATNLLLQLSPSSIVAGGGQTSTATATVTDASGNPVPGDVVSFSSSGGNAIGPVTDNGDGTYTATITSTTSPGSVTITATDNSVANVSGQATLTQTSGPAAKVVLQLSSSSIVADGSSAITATATVTDAGGQPVVGDNVSFSSSGGNAIGPVTDHGNGTYTAVITSTSTAGTLTITATDATAGVSAQTSLRQTAGRAANVTVQLSPPAILASGTSSSLATATVTDAHGNPVPGEVVTFSSTGGNSIGPVTDHGDGTYSAQITSTTTIGSATITATDATTHVSGQATLTQLGSVTSLVAQPVSPATNQTVTLVGTVSAASGTQSGTLAFENGGAPISGCSAKPITPAAPAATCRTSLLASSSPAQITAVFTPDASSQVAGSSGTLRITVHRAATLTALDVSNTTVSTGRSATYTATVTPAYPGAASPSGTVAFQDGGSPIAACGAQRVHSGAGSTIATCTVSYAHSGTHRITAGYSGDANFGASASSPPQSVTVRAQPPRVLGIVTSTMEWSFHFTPAYTKVLAFVINGPPIGSTVTVTCHGSGCPFGRLSTAITKTRRCARKGKHSCTRAAPRQLDLKPRFGNHALLGGAMITVRIVRPNWIGKYYRFTMRARHPPNIEIKCLAPGSTKPGVGC